MTLSASTSRQPKQHNKKRRRRLPPKRRAQAELATYRASPVGRAEAAFADGAGFFQVDMPITEVSRKVLKQSYTIAGTDEYKTGYGVGRRQHAGQADTLSAIEAVGWRLEHAGYAYVMTGQISRDKLMSSGQEVGVMGTLTGIYLFRRDETAAPPAPPAPSAPPPPLSS